MPERQFLGVTGTYDEQQVAELPNLRIVPNTPDMQELYDQTRIILMPSKYESWGMVATEAMACGIPVIYNPTFGLCENVGASGIAVKEVAPVGIDLDVHTLTIKGGEYDGIDPEANLKGWVKAIKSLDNPKTYDKYVQAGLARARELDPEKEMAAFEKFIMA